jgi:hypothetical protein
LKGFALLQPGAMVEKPVRYRIYHQKERVWGSEAKKKLSEQL